jgi:copper chaperone CopZ
LTGDPDCDLKEYPMCNTTASYTVVGMTCNGCVTKVTKAVEGVDGVLDVDVDIADGTLQVSGHIDDTAIRDAVAGIGYQIAN